MKTDMLIFFTSQCPKVNQGGWCVTFNRRDSAKGLGKRSILMILILVKAGKMLKFHIMSRKMKLFIKLSLNWEYDFVVILIDST